MLAIVAKLTKKFLKPNRYNRKGASIYIKLLHYNFFLVGQSKKLIGECPYQAILIPYLLHNQAMISKKIYFGGSISVSSQ